MAMTYIAEDASLEKAETYMDEYEWWLQHDFKNVFTQQEKAESHKVKKKCKHCGKEFPIRSGEVSRYRYCDFQRGKKHFFCSWTCLSLSRKEKTDEQR